MESVLQNRITPEQIEQLSADEIFVFGTNLMGNHYGGAAQMACKMFGAGGVSEGIKGQTYAIPVVLAGVERVKPHIETFLDYAEAHPENRFLVTRIGCGLAGFTDEDIAPLFARAIDMANVTLPQSFWAILKREGLYLPDIPTNRIAPYLIKELAEGEIFVFGSNLWGKHYGGAAHLATTMFGAEWGVGVGLTGRTYAIPTMRAGVDMIKPYVNDFITFAREHKEYRFLVTRIGCGIAGFTDEDIAPLFAEAVDVENIALPHSFWRVIVSKG